jgi:3D (Asp-Asp-Asp) domain-containing protein
MKNLARGSVFLFGFVALIVSLFYVQPQVEAVTTTSFSADLSNSQINSFEVEQEKQQKQEVETQHKQNGAVNATTALEHENNTETTIEDKTANSASNAAAAAAAVTAAKTNARGFSATAYCLRGRTATGGSVRRGIVAADPRVLPLGTRIQLNAGSYSGSYIVADTGGAVKGRKLDIWVPSCAEAIRFGRRTVTVSLTAKK